MVVISFKQYGTLLATRALARDIYPDIACKIQNDTMVILDWEGVQMVTLSFSDEIFGLLFKNVGFTDFKQRTHFTNITPGISLVLSTAISMRTKHPLGETVD